MSSTFYSKFYSTHVEIDIASGAIMSRDIVPYEGPWEGAMGLETATATAILKTVYEGDLKEQINQDTTALKYIVDGDMTGKKWEGAKVVVALHTKRNSGVKAIALNTGQIPQAGNQGTANAEINMKKWFGHIQLTADIMAQAKTNKGAFVNALTMEQEGMVNDISRQRNRGLNYFGQGTLAVVSAGANSATQAIKDPGNVVGTVNPERFIKVGDVIAITSSDGTVLRGVQTVLSITTPNVVFDAAINTTTGDLLSFGSNSVAPGESSFNAEPIGLLGLIDSTTYVSNAYTIDRSLAANAFWRSNVLTSVGSLNPDLLNRAIQNNHEISGKKIKKMYTHYGVAREILKLTEQDKRYNVQPGNKGSSFQAGPEDEEFGFGGKDGTADRDAPYGTLFMFPEDGYLERYELGESGWAEEDGNLFLRAQFYDQYEARYRLREQFFNSRPNAFTRLDGITNTVSSGAFGL